MINSLVCVPSPLKKSPPPTPPEGGEKKPLPLPLSQGEGSKMQIDLANALVCKAYFVYYVLFIISPQACTLPSFGGVREAPPPLGGVRGGLERVLCVYQMG